MKLVILLVLGDLCNFGYFKLAFVVGFVCGFWALRGLLCVVGVYLLHLGFCGTLWCLFFGFVVRAEGGFGFGDWFSRFADLGVVEVVCGVWWMMLLDLCDLCNFEYVKFAFMVGFVDSVVLVLWFCLNSCCFVAAVALLVGLCIVASCGLCSTRDGFWCLVFCF